MSKNKCFAGILAVLLPVCIGAVELPEGIQNDFRRYFADKEYLLQGGSAIFDDCVIAVGSAVNNPERANIMRAVALSDANSNLITTVYGATVKASQEIKDESVAKGDNYSATVSGKSIYRTKIENQSLSRNQICGEWISEDGKTYFVAVARFFRKKSATPRKIIPVQQPTFLVDFKPYGNWRNALLSVRGIMCGGAALYIDEYGEEYLICAASAPARLPYSQQLEVLKIKAGAEAVGYVNGNMVDDQRYLEENFSTSDSNNVSAAEEELIRRHVQTSVRQGAIRRMTPVGSWKVDNMPNRVFRAFMLRLSDVASESFPVVPEGADEKSDTVEIDTADDSGKQLGKALEKAEFYEKDDEISVVLPDNSPVFGKNEDEIELADPMQNQPLPAALRPAEKINAVCNFTFPQISIGDVNIDSDINTNILRRGFLPVRVYRTGYMPHKRLVLRRHHHFHKRPRNHHSGPRFHKMPHPPKFKIRTPRPGHKFPRFKSKSQHRRHAAPRRVRRR